MSEYFSASIAGRIINFFGRMLAFLFRATGKILGAIIAIGCIIFLGVLVFALLNMAVVGAAIGSVTLIGISAMAYVVLTIITALLPLILLCLLMLRLVFGVKSTGRLFVFILVAWLALGAYLVVTTLRNSAQIEILTTTISNSSNGQW